MKCCKIFLFIIAFFFSLNLYAQSTNKLLEIKHLTGDLYVYTTYNTYGGKLVPANAMYLITDSGAVMIDTPWDKAQFQPLLDSIEVKHHKKVIFCIATHFHDDRTGGFSFLKEKGIATYSSKKTYDLCKEKNQNTAEFSFRCDTVFKAGQYEFKTFFPGEGHTTDNLVIWFSKDRVLYGGCLVKSTEATDMGFTGDGNIRAWPQTIKAIQKKFPHPAFIIPGHQSWASLKSLVRTLKLIEQTTAKK